MSRGLIANTAGTALFVVIEDVLYSVAPDGVRTSRGVLQTRRGHVGMKIGLTQLVIVDGVNGYVYDLQAQTFTEITSEGWLGSHTVEQLGGYFSFIDPNTQTFYNSALEDAATLDASEFATANNSPDKLVGQVRTGNVLVYFGEVSAEIWQLNDTVTAGDSVFLPYTGTVLEVGLLAAHTAKSLDNSAYWLGRTVNGGGIVYRMEGFRAVRISTKAIEWKIQKAIREGNDVSKACAYAYQQDGNSFYVLQVPGLETTWSYEVSSGQWHERCDVRLGDRIQHRGNYHAYCYGKHLIAGDDDIVYEYDPDKHTNNGDVLLRERISPHYAHPQLNPITFGRFQLDCTVGEGIDGQSEAKVGMRYSDDGGYGYTGWDYQTLGAVGQRNARPVWNRTGATEKDGDRVWHVRCTDNAPFAIINAVVEATPAK
jgi:hypothetical protein